MPFFLTWNAAGHSALHLSNAPTTEPMKTFSKKIAACYKRTRAAERQATAHVIRGLLFNCDIPEDRRPQALRIVEAMKAKEPSLPEKRGPFSGLTRSELAATRTLEPDWY
jgi:hypothetical protein